MFDLVCVLLVRVTEALLEHRDQQGHLEWDFMDQRSVCTTATAVTMLQRSLTISMFRVLQVSPAHQVYLDHREKVSRDQR